ncbi:penicillin-binding transpeptidase domain-containing protein [Arthrobacter sp. H35-D1]|uniref:penicillin-binding transpeptidase domain-containing protein n=1 Tax=Arthrobacter sp. H35-D1 TaxID=3046202 RepID=UPI0024B8CB38|nr:penicillin-binding transpeptidase domain-containing protein [Arthrobacter sp. H35-D1]MDJ0314512.1 penicillin-binding transpeptidase domain-containing protein [Arthrobacter sp. H35-D1]
MNTYTNVRESMIRRATTMLLTLGLVLAGTACSPQDDGTSTADALAKALSSHSVGDVKFDVPAAEVQKELTELSKGIDPVWPTVSVSGVEIADDDTARVALDYSWAIPTLEKPWTYSTSADMTRDGKAWTIAWTPEMVEPKLAAGDRLKLTTTRGRRANILAADGEAIVKERPVKIVGINKDGLSDAEAQTGAKALAAVVNIDPGAYAAKVKAYGPVAFVDAITLRAEDFAALDTARLDAVEGILVTSATQPLAPSRTFAQAILGSVHEATAEDIEKSDGEVVAGQVVGSGGLQASFDAQLAGDPGITISTVAASVSTPTESAPADSTSTDDAGTSSEAAAPPSKVLYSVDPVDGKDVKTTLLPALQSAAEDALSEVKTPSSIVVMRPSTGAIVASANGPDSASYNTAFLGQYAPGSTFKIATSLGLLRQGMSPSSTVNCTPEYIADGKKFLNAPGYAPEATGEISLTSAVAHSCNTAFVSQFEKLSQEKLADAAGALGIGMANDLGLGAFTGNVPRDSAGTEHAASMIGQGKVQVSPLAMAAMMSSVVKGAAVVPVLVDGHDGGAKAAEGAALTAKESGELRTMMRAVVTDGYLDMLGGLPGPEVIGKTGTAEFGSDAPPRTHSWVIAAQGDIAVAVFVEDGDLGAVTGGPLAKTILEAAAAK